MIPIIWKNKQFAFDTALTPAEIEEKMCQAIDEGKADSSMAHPPMKCILLDGKDCIHPFEFTYCVVEREGGSHIEGYNVPTGRRIGRDPDKSEDRWEKEEPETFWQSVGTWALMIVFAIPMGIAMGIECLRLYYRKKKGKGPQYKSDEEYLTRFMTEYVGCTPSELMPEAICELPDSYRGKKK